MMELNERVAALKAQLGPDLVILGHHYQRDEVIQFADFRGDSLQLAQDARRTDARYIVFCGVHFMAETAAILAKPHQTVLLPDLEAGCFLADRADLPLVQQAWIELGRIMDVEQEVMPVTYINSAADLKAFCGRHGGIICTSANTGRVLTWALQQRPRVLFLPDQNLGYNVARQLGIADDEIVVWNHRRFLGGQSPERIRRARLILWPGWCYVHTRFRPNHVRAWRERDPEIRILVHPECTPDVVALADEIGSTSYIVRRVKESPPGTKWAIGTEANLVLRLAREHPEQSISYLGDEPHYCRTMNRITLEKLARVLEGLLRGELVNPITVPPETAEPARLAVERMLQIG